MIKSIEIEKFRGIENGKLDDFTPLTILVGPNSCGKSTVLDALFLGASSDPQKIASHFTNRNNQNLELRWLIYKPLKNSNARVRLITDVDGDNRTFAMQLSEIDSERIVFDFYSLEVNASPFFTFSSDGLRGYVSSVNHLIPKCEGVREISYIDFDQDNTAMTLVDLYSQSNRLGRSDIVEKELNEILPGLDQVRVLTHKGQPRLEAIYKWGSVPLAMEGEGIQSLMRLNLALSACDDGTVLLEEPEIHQYPRSIRLSAKMIVSAVKRGVQVFVSTHSLELIDALLIEAKEADYLDNLSVFNLFLKDGCLRHSCTSGSDAEFARFQIEDDLR